VNSLSFALQLGTLMPVLIGVTLVRVLAMWHYASQRRVYPGFRTLMLAAVLVFAGIAVLMLRAKLGESVLLVILSNVVLLGPDVLVYHGLGEYGRLPHLRTRTMQNVVFVALVCLVQTADIVFDPNMGRRVVIFSIAALLFSTRIALELPWLCSRRLPGMKILCLSYLITAGLQIVRGVNALSVPGFTLLTMGQGDVLGVYSVFYRIVQSVLDLYVVFAMNSAMLENDLQVATSQIEHMAQTDALTGALNRRGMELLGEEALRRSFALNMPAAVLMLDLDHFKLVNDSLGHAAGDKLLRAVAALCAGALRKEDVFARYGGEEFVVIVPQAGLREAGLLAQRMRLAIAEARFPVMGGAGVTVSIGVAGAREGSLDGMLTSADAALYQAKQSGRNRVVVAIGQDEAEKRFVAEEEA